MFRTFAYLFTLCCAITSFGETFSGPQVGEKTTPFKVLDFSPGRDPVERDPIADNRGGATALVFVHAVERSLVPLLRAIDQYGAARSNLLKTEVVFLFPDRLTGEQRVKAVLGSLQLKARAGLSLDGAEGPGNYGLNKECMMTIVGARDNVVATNFALVQPGIADASRVVAALAKICGDTNPPPVADLTQAGMRPARPADGKGKGEPFPGAVPTDPRLNQLFRQIIRATNDVARVDALHSEMSKLAKENADLRQQTIDGWSRVLHFGDHYGNDYSRKLGREMLEALKKPVGEK